MNTQNNAPIIAVIGDANEGKTSLIRAILAEEFFGIIKDEAGTTTVSEKYQVFLEGELVFDLFDNPGFEFSSSVRLNVQDFSPKNIAEECERQKNNAATHWEQNAWSREQSAWESVDKSDVLLWVIDVRKCPSLTAFSDTAYLLAKSKKHIIPVFNFLPEERQGETVGNNFSKEITALLTDHSLKSLICNYDTNRRDFDNEIDLLLAISISLKSYEGAYRRFRTYIKRLEERESLRLDNACLDICDALMSTACYVEKKDNVQYQDLESVKRELQAEYVANLTRFERDVFRKIIEHWTYKDVDAVVDCRFTIPLSVEVSTREYSWSDVQKLLGGDIFFVWYGGKEVMVTAAPASFRILCSRLIDLIHAIRTRSKAVMKENNPVLKDRQISIPADMLNALQTFGLHNRTGALLHQGENYSRNRAEAERLRTSLIIFLQQLVMQQQVN